VAAAAAEAGTVGAAEAKVGLAVGVTDVAMEVEVETMAEAALEATMEAAAAMAAVAAAEEMVALTAEEAKVGRVAALMVGKTVRRENSDHQQWHASTRTGVAHDR